MAGKVKHETTVLDKPGKQYPEDIDLDIAQPPRFVGRGGEKLDGFLEKFPIVTQDAIVLDVGASTGGFTDCLLQRGIRAAVCLDVGHGQLHYKLQIDPRVTNIEKTNARHITPEKLPHPDYDIIVMDLSFISLRVVWPAIWPFLKDNGHLIALVKPQFEAGKKEVDKGRGIIRDSEIHARVLEELRGFASQELEGATEFGLCESPIKGTDGNTEFLLGLKKIAST